MKKTKTFREIQLALNQYYINQPKPPMIRVSKMPLPFHSCIEAVLTPYSRL